ncbi:hypothetical protein [Streptomyces sp. NPDC088766]
MRRATRNGVIAVAAALVAAALVGAAALILGGAVLHRRSRPGAER